MEIGYWAPPPGFGSAGLKWNIESAFLTSLQRLLLIWGPPLENH